MKRAKIASLSPAELLPVLRVAKDRRTRDWAIVLVGYLHGCRANEISNFVLDDLNPRTGCLLVRRLKGSLETSQALHPHRGEPLLDEVKALKAWLKERRDDGSPFLFNSQKGGRLSRFQVFRISKSAPRPQGCRKIAGSRIPLNTHAPVT